MLGASTSRAIDRCHSVARRRRGQGRQPRRAGADRRDLTAPRRARQSTVDDPNCALSIDRETCAGEGGATPSPQGPRLGAAKANGNGVAPPSPATLTAVSSRARPVRNRPDSARVFPVRRASPRGQRRGRRRGRRTADHAGPADDPAEADRLDLEGDVRIDGRGTQIERRRSEKPDRQFSRNVGSIGARDR